MPRDVSGRDLLRALARLGYQLSRQKGSHAIVTTQVRGEHHVAVPVHDPIKIGTLNNILRDVAEHHGLTRDELLDRLELV
jgi:predicted RNA binding protein YcfA (HicA-like mRNA interferase family)